MLRHKFVELRPTVLEEGVLYISVEYCSAIHKCVCGCGNEVVTPISPTGWQLSFDGRTVSLSPSIGNWNFDCQSHYWIRKNEVHFAEPWTEEQIQLGRRRDKQLKEHFYADSEHESRLEANDEGENVHKGPARLTFWGRIMRILSWLKLKR